MFKGLIFDVHGVLVFDFPIKKYHDGVINILKEIPNYSSWSDERLLELFKNSKKVYGTGANFFYSIGKKETYANMLSQLPITGMIPQEIFDLIKKLKEKGMKNYIVTDTTTSIVARIFEKSGLNWKEAFEFVVSLDVIAKPKPNPDMYEFVLGISKIPPHDMCIIGDRWTDIQPGLELGMCGFLVKSKEHIINFLEGMVWEENVTGIKTKEESSSIQNNPEQ